MELAVCCAVMCIFGLAGYWLFGTVSQALSASVGAALVGDATGLLAYERWFKLRVVTRPALSDGAPRHAPQDFVATVPLAGGR
jgi:hypothetical protein